jgi:hypothetical protein
MGTPASDTGPGTRRPPGRPAWRLRLAPIGGRFRTPPVVLAGLGGVHVLARRPAIHGPRADSTSGQPSLVAGPAALPPDGRPAWPVGPADHRGRRPPGLTQPQAAHVSEARCCASSDVIGAERPRLPARANGDPVPFTVARGESNDCVTTAQVRTPVLDSSQGCGAPGSGSTMTRHSSFPCHETHRPHHTTPPHVVFRRMPCQIPFPSP